jgi:hydrogenase small subunit
MFMGKTSVRIIHLLFKRRMEEAMHISRRDFLKTVAASAMLMGLDQLHLFKLAQALARTGAGKTPVIWLTGSGCTGDSVSLLNAVNPTVDQVLINTINVGYQPTLMAAAGDLAVTSAKSMAQAGGYILVVEGGIPTGFGGDYCFVWSEAGNRVTMASAVTSLAAQAQYIVAVGTCAAYGGIPGAYAPTATKGVGAFLGRSVVNLPGCPAHPDWIIGTLAQVIGGTVPALDSYGRPNMYYSKTVHNQCPRREFDDASQLGQPNRCMEEIGCRGPHTYADCPTRMWNNGQSWCIGVNSPCIACTEPTFPSFPLRAGGGG